MTKKVVVNMAEAQFKETINRMVEQKLFDILMNENDPLFRETFHEITKRTMDELAYRFRNQNSGMDNQMVRNFVNLLTSRILNDLDKAGAITYFDEKPTQDIMYQITTPGENSYVAKQPLKNKIRGTKYLIINDPFFFHTPSDLTPEQYGEQLMDTLPLTTLKKVVIIYQKPKRPDALNYFQANCPKDIELDLIRDDSIHDRVWILDSKKAYLVGTSFGGLGKKVSFITRLSKQDLLDFQTWLELVFEKHKKQL